MARPATAARALSDFENPPGPGRQRLLSRVAAVEGLADVQGLAPLSVARPEPAGAAVLSPGARLGFSCNGFECTSSYTY